jgi:hypothetical protein
MMLRRRSGPANGKARNEEISLSQSNRAKDVSPWSQVWLLASLCLMLMIDTTLSCVPQNKQKNPTKTKNTKGRRD